VIPINKIYCEKVKMSWFSLGNWFFCIKFMQLAVAGKSQHSCAPPKRKEIGPEMQLSISHWSIKMIGPGGLLLVVTTYMQFQLQFYWWGCQTKKKAILRHLILFSKVTY